MQNDEGKGLEPNRDKQKNEARDALTTIIVVETIITSIMIRSGEKHDIRLSIMHMNTDETQRIQNTIIHGDDETSSC